MNGQMSKEPLVSIGMPVYNGERFLREAIESLLGQDYRNLELVICDNDSTDGTAAICQEFARRDPRVGYRRHQANVGMLENFNRAFRASAGEFFMWAGDHDNRRQDFISRCMEELAYDRDAVLCAPRAEWIDEQGSSQGTIPVVIDTRGMGKLERLQVVLWGVEYPYQIYGVIRSSALRRTRLFQRTIGSDNVLLAELAMLGGFAALPDVLLGIRRSPAFGGFAKYVRELGYPANGIAGFILFWRMVLCHVAAVNRHLNRAGAKLSVPPLFFLSVVARHAWMLQSLLAVGRERTAS